MIKFIKRFFNKPVVPTIAEGSEANESKTGTPQIPVNYEINVSFNGKHVFATDSTIRNYRLEDIRRLQRFFKQTLPCCKIDVYAKYRACSKRLADE